MKGSAKWRNLTIMDLVFEIYLGCPQLLITVSPLREHNITKYIWVMRVDYKNKKHLQQ